MIGDLEKKLFDSERDKVLLRREKDDLSKEIKDLDASKDRNVVSQEMVSMIKEN